MTKTRRDSEYFAALQEESLKRKAEQSFRTFAEWMWPILEPSTPFLPNWHIDLICESLQAVTEGKISRLVINLPPRYGKSLLVSVLWPCWEWVRNPSLRSVFASYSESLSTKHAVDRRRVLTSPLYQRLWGTRVTLAPDQRTKLDLHNTRRGAMIATSVGGSITGKGGNRIIIDDPHNPMQAESDKQRTHAIDFFTGTLSTRLDSHQHGAIVVVAQRLHHEDLSGYCLNQGFASVILPVEAPRATSIQFPLSGRHFRREAGDLLWPAREGRVQLASQRENLGSTRFAGQYQQEPSPAEGITFKRSWWRFYDVLPECEQYGQSWDLSFKGGPTNDYVVGLVAGRQGACIYLIDRVKARMSFRDTCAAIKQLVMNFPACSAVYIEDAANGPAVVDLLYAEVRGIIAVSPEGGKQCRAQACEPRVEAGQVYLPNPRRRDGSLIPERAWVEDFIEQLAQFPNGANDDDVDAFTQLLVKWKPTQTNSAGEVFALMMNDETVDDWARLPADYSMSLNRKF